MTREDAGAPPDFHRFRASQRDMQSPQRINHEETKSTKVFSGFFFVPFVSSWLILMISGRRSLRHERLRGAEQAP
jgi:hypothetical protein